MKRQSWGPTIAILGVAFLLAGPGAIEAQRSSGQQDPDRFFQVGNVVFNRDLIARAEFVPETETLRARVDVYAVGAPVAVNLYDNDIERFRSALLAPARRTVEELVDPKGSRFVASDDFDGALHLNWKPVRPDPSHVSLSKNPGKLTITTQRGTIHGEESKDELSGGIAAKNLYLIDNPLAEGADFVVTTCVSGFTPKASFQQAGLILYDDDDNYLKFGYEFDWRKGEGQTFIGVVEVDGEPAHRPIEGSEQGLDRFWLRITKRGTNYALATSLDGKTFRDHGHGPWREASPKRIGILAKNGGTDDAPEVDAAFESFELRSPPSKD